MLREAIPNLLTIIAPRHPERGDAVSSLLRENGLTHSRRSLKQAVSSGTQVYLADTIGELGLFYTVAPLSFIGGSLVSHGGQNPIEAIKLGSAILSGPHTFNFTEAYQVLARYDGYKIVGGLEDLAAELRVLFENPAQAAEMKNRAAAAIGTLEGAMERTLAVLEAYYPALGGSERNSRIANPEAGVTEHAA